MTEHCPEDCTGCDYCTRPAARQLEQSYAAQVDQTEAERRAREVWPEAEGFLPNTRGWTFRVGAGYASVTTAGVVARDPQGTRYDAVTYMGRRTPPAGPVAR
jgi:hypothetical protein